MSLSRLFCFSLFCVLFSSTIWAYEPGIHATISAEAMRQYRLCVPDDTRIEARAKLFIESSRREDNVLHNPNRSREWHFFSVRGDLGRSEEGVRISLNTRFDELLKVMARYLENPLIEDYELGKLYETLGRLVHYVQDVTVPANVIPIYHSSGKPDLFSGYGFDKNASQSYFANNQQSICAEVNKTITLAKADKLPDAKVDLYALLKSLSLRTLTASEHETFVLNTGKKQKQLAWSLFWLEHKQCRKRTKNRFKDYGLFGNRFGLQKLKDRCDPDEGASALLKYCKDLANCNVDKNSYVEFAARRHLEAVIASQQILLYLKNLLDRRQAENTDTFIIER